MTATALTIAGSDPSGGAGIQADHKTFASHQVYGCSVITALTAQNTQGVAAVEVVDANFVDSQLRVLRQDLRIDAGKTGMLANAAIIRRLAAALRQDPLPALVVDPVMVATSGHRLLSLDAEDVLREELLPLAQLITPNLPEVGVLLAASPPRDRADMIEAAWQLRRYGAQAVYIKGGHQQAAEVDDILLFAEDIHCLTYPRIDSTATHGTGCSLSAAITAHLARGTALPQACAQARAWLQKAIAAGAIMAIGQGKGPVDHRIPAWQGEEL